MKRFFKTCGSLVLAASLVVSVFGVKTASAADKAMTFEEFTSLYTTVKTATNAVASTSPTKTDVTGKLEIPLLGAVDIAVSDILDPVNHTSKMTSTTAGVSKETYIDLTKGCAYSYNTDNARYEVNKGTTSTSTVGFLDALNFDKIADCLTITVGAGKKIGDVACQETDVALKLEGEKLAAVMGDLSKAMGGSLPDLGGSSSLGSIDLKTGLKGIDLKLALFVDESYILRGTDAEGSITVDLMGSSLNIPITMSATSDVTSESVVIPSEIAKSAQLVVGFVVSKSGAKFKSALSGKNTIFSVTGVTNTKAKKLTIPATISQFGKSYKVSTAAKNAFSKAKKLKTLVIKNKALKKAVKKNFKKYGLTKKVKIK